MVLPSTFGIARLRVVELKRASRTYFALKLQSEGGLEPPKLPPRTATADFKGTPSTKTQHFSIGSALIMEWTESTESLKDPETMPKHVITVTRKTRTHLKPADSNLLDEIFKVGPLPKEELPILMSSVEFHSTEFSTLTPRRLCISILSPNSLLQEREQLKCYTFMAKPGAERPHPPIRYWKSWECLGSKKCQAPIGLMDTLGNKFYSWKNSKAALIALPSCPCVTHILQPCKSREVPSPIDPATTSYALTKGQTSSIPEFLKITEQPGMHIDAESPKKSAVATSAMTKLKRKFEPSSESIQSQQKLKLEPPTASARPGHKTLTWQQKTIEESRKRKERAQMKKRNKELKRQERVRQNLCNAGLKQYKPHFTKADLADWKLKYCKYCSTWYHLDYMHNLDSTCKC